MGRPDRREPALGYVLHLRESGSSRLRGTPRMQVRDVRDRRPEFRPGRRASLLERSPRRPRSLCAPGGVLRSLPEAASGGHGRALQVCGALRSGAYGAVEGALSARARVGSPAAALSVQGGSSWVALSEAPGGLAPCAHRVAFSGLFRGLAAGRPRVRPPRFVAEEDRAFRSGHCGRPSSLQAVTPGGSRGHRPPEGQGIAVMGSNKGDVLGGLGMEGGRGTRRGQECPRA